jgi:hypothetical protein
MDSVQKCASVMSLSAVILGVMRQAVQHDFVWKSPVSFQPWVVSIHLLDPCDVACAFAKHF